MHDLQELKEMRAEMTGRRPEGLRSARDLLLAEARSGGRRRWATWTHDIRPRIRPRATLIAGTAVAVSAAITAALLAGSPGHSAPPAGPPSGTPVLTVAYVLGRAASAAAAAHQPVPRPGQYIYVSSVATELSLEGGSNGQLDAWLTTTDRRIWQSASGYRAGVLQRVARGQQKLPWGVTPPPAPGGRVQWDPLSALACPGAAPPQGSYAFLATLPTAVPQLQAWIYGHKEGSQPANEQVWTDIGDLLRETLVPPKLAAALFKVAATIPGARVVRNATDAAGRSGIAVARYDSGFKADMELIFKPGTYQLLGERSVLAKPVQGEGPAGTVVQSTAQLRTSVASRLPHFTSSVPQSKLPTGPGC